MEAALISIGRSLSPQLYHQVYLRPGVGAEIINPDPGSRKEKTLIISSTKKVSTKAG